MDATDDDDCCIIDSEATIDVMAELPQNRNIRFLEVYMRSECERLKPEICFFLSHIAPRMTSVTSLVVRLPEIYDPFVTLAVAGMPQLEKLKFRRSIKIPPSHSSLREVFIRNARLDGIELPTSVRKVTVTKHKGDLRAFIRKLPNLDDLAVELANTREFNEQNDIIECAPRVCTIRGPVVTWVGPVNSTVSGVEHLSLRFSGAKLYNTTGSFLSADAFRDLRKLCPRLKTLQLKDVHLCDCTTAVKPTDTVGLQITRCVD